MAKKALGRGIEALIPGLPDEAQVQVVDVNLSEIEADPNQPRQTFDDDKISELARSIEEHGVIQPLLVRRVGSKYRLVAGERRLRAARRAGLAQVPVVVREMDDRQAMEISLVENLQREDLGPLEQAEAFQRLSREFGLTQEEIARRVGKSRPEIANTLRLLRLEPEVREMISSGLISGGHGRALVGLEREQQIKCARQIVSRSLSVRNVEDMVSSRGQSVRSPSRPKPSARRKDAESILGEILGSPVKVTEKDGKGTVSISFFGEEDLERLVEIMERGIKVP